MRLTKSGNVWFVGSWTVQVVRPNPELYMGRFGGGWQWKLGFQASKHARTIILNLLTFYVRIHRPRPVRGKRPTEVLYDDARF